MDKKKYDILCRKAFNKTSQEHYYPYSLFESHYKELESISEDRANIVKIDDELVELCKMHSLKAGILSLSINIKNKDTAVVNSLFNTIANDILAIINLLLGGLEYQAYIVFRNLYEVSLTLLVIMIDEKKRDEYYKSAKKKNTYTVWRDNFTHKRLNETLTLYEKSITPDGELKFISEWRIKSYKKYSEFVHGDFFNIYAYSRTRPQTKDANEILSSNLWGGILSRTNDILMEMADLLFYVDSMYMRILEDKTISFRKENIISQEEEDKDYWNKAIELMLIVQEYFFEIKSRIEE